MESAHVFTLFAASDGIVNKILVPIKIPDNFLVSSVRLNGLSARFLTSVQASANIWWPLLLLRVYSSHIIKSDKTICDTILHCQTYSYGLEI